MIGILDPALLQPRSDELARYELTLVARTCQAHGIRLIPFEEYWDPMWSEFGRSLEHELVDPMAKQALREVRKLGQRHSTAGFTPVPPSVAWRRGFQQLFNASWLVSDWEERMARAVVRAVIADDDVIVLTRRVVGRNLNVLSSGHCTLDENTRWLLHVQPRGVGPRHIPCVHHPRNLTTRWTGRFDWRLPADSDGARYPFCPPADWWKPSTTAHATVQSKPAWIDGNGRGWARPNIPGGAGYHWDVYIRVPAEQQKLGVNQLNIVEFGAPLSEGVVGGIHHKGHLVKNVGWSCP